jgi:pimeloyl-ACP methyl ester carboxylesterase
LEKDTLFLHAGPGLNASVEHQVLRQRFSTVHFWDQPPVHTAKHAFTVLLDAAIAEVDKLAEANGQPVKLTTHSFGGHLASGLLERIPDRIGDCHLFNPIYDIPSGFLNLLKIMGRSDTTEIGLRERIAVFLSEKNRNTGDQNDIWSYVNLIVSDAHFLRHYWPSAAHYAAYATRAQTGPGIDFTTFQNVLRDFLEHHFERCDPFSGPQRIMIEVGGRDPLQVQVKDLRPWVLRFPAAQIIVKPESGHFIHLDSYL